MGAILCRSCPEILDECRDDGGGDKTAMPQGLKRFGVTNTKMYVENPRITFYRNLKKLIKLHGTGYKRCADDIGLPRDVLHMYLYQHRFPGPEALQALAQAFGVPVEVFFRR